MHGPTATRLARELGIDLPSREGVKRLEPNFTEICDRLGEPHLLTRVNGSPLLVIERNADGDGIEFGRMSTDEDNGGMTAWAQINEMVNFSENRGLRPRWTVMTTENSGARYHGHRPDLALLLLGLCQGWCQWTSWRSVDRMARSLPTGEYVKRLLLGAKTDLYFTEMGRAIDWTTDNLTVLILQILGVEWRNKVWENTSKGRKALAEAGRGITGQLTPGFLHDDEGWPAQDLKKWPWIEDLIDMACDPGKRGSTREITQALRSKYPECRFTQATVRNIIRRDAYFDGVCIANVDGVDHLCRPIQLVRPIPQEKVRLARRNLDRRKGKATRTNLGTYLAAGITITHVKSAEAETVPVAPQTIREVMAYRGPQGSRDVFRKQGFEEQLKRLFLKMARDLPSGHIRSPEEAEALEARIQELKREKERLASECVEDFLGKDWPVIEIAKAMHTATSSVGRELESAERRRRMSSVIPEVTRDFADFNDRMILGALEEVFENRDDDPAINELAALILEDGLSEVVIHGIPRDFELEIRGPISGAQPLTQALFPLQAARRHLEPYIWCKVEAIGEQRRRIASDGSGIGLTDVKTASQVMARDAVLTKPRLDPFNDCPRRARRRPQKIVEGTPAWVGSAPSSPDEPT